MQERQKALSLWIQEGCRKEFRRKEGVSQEGRRKEACREEGVSQEGRTEAISLQEADPPAMMECSWGELSKDAVVTPCSVVAASLLPCL